MSRKSKIDAIKKIPIAKTKYVIWVARNVEKDLQVCYIMVKGRSTCI